MDDDLPSWPVKRLRELAIWHAATTDGVEVVEQPDEIALLTDPAADHGINAEVEMLATEREG